MVCPYQKLHFYSKKQGQNILQVLQNAFNGNPFILQKT